MAVEIVTEMQKLVKQVVIKDKTIYVVVPNIGKFKTDAVTQLTVRPNKRRTDEKRFHFLLHFFVRTINPQIKGKHINVKLIAPAGKDVPALRGPKGQFIKRDHMFVGEDGQVLTMDLNETTATA